MPNQVLIINITRMGDLIQMTPLLARLEEECPGVQIDLIVDKEFSHVARLLPRVRHIWDYDFQGLMDDSRVRARDVVSLHQELSHWCRPLLAMGYDRVINLTFNRRSAFLVKFFGCDDERGMTTAPDGSFVVKNPWMKYFLDFHVYRNVNRFNIVDLFSLGGSGPGSFHPVHITVESESRDWAKRFLRQSGCPQTWVGVQVGASDSMKAWRPEYFGQVMAHLSLNRKIGFILIGSKKEEGQVNEALQIYRKMGGQGIVCEAVGQTTIPQLVGILEQCQLMLTNDTGPMHLAVGVGTPVVNLSVGHVDFWETGPFGPGNWVLQPQISCGPCGFDMVCSHHACKDLIRSQEVAEFCAWIIGIADFPKFSSRVRVYEGGMDQNHLGTYALKVGTEDPLVTWYGKFWRYFWYRHLTGRQEADFPSFGPPLDFAEVQQIWQQLYPSVHRVRELAESMNEMCHQTPIPIDRLKKIQHQLKTDTLEIQQLARSSLMFGPLSVALLRDTFCLESSSLGDMTREHAQAYFRFEERIETIRAEIEEWEPCNQRRDLYASTIG